MKTFKNIVKLIIIGCIIGLIISLFQFLTHEVIIFSEYLLNKSYLIFLSTIICSIILLIVLIFINEKNPGYYGSGIPLLEKYQHSTIEFSGIKMLIFIFINSLYSFFTGYLLGSEGPSISISSAIGKISNDITKKEDKELVCFCGSAGFSVAFLSPFAGLTHLIEENKKRISLHFILKGILVISIAFTISYLLYPHSLLPKFISSYLPLKYYILLILLTNITILISKIYMFLITKIKDLTKGKKILIYLTFILMIIFLILKRYKQILVGSGSSLLNTSTLDYSLFMILGILIFRLLFTSLSLSMKTSGGLVLPSLAIGFLMGAIFVNIFKLFDSNIEQYSTIFIICSMMITFSVISKAPMTAFILALKCMSIKVIIIPIIVCLLITTIICYLYKWNSIYHHLEKRL